MVYDFISPALGISSGEMRILGDDLLAGESLAYEEKFTCQQSSCDRRIQILRLT